MKRVVICNSYFYKKDAKQWKLRQPYPPLATILAAALLRDAGYQVKFFDTNLRDNPEEITGLLRELQPQFLVIYDDGFNYLSKMCLSTMRDAALRLIMAGKLFRCTVVVSSPDASDHFEKYLDAGADYILRGEAEQTLLALLAAIENKKDADLIAGLAFRKEGSTITTSQRVVMKDLDALPMPAWDLVDILSYRRIWQKHHGYFSLNIATTRGCPFRCNWCAKPIYGNRYNSRSAKHVTDEIEYLLKNYQPDHFWMCDDIFGLKPGWIGEFSALVQERQLRFRFKIQSRVDLLLEEGTVKALASSGAETVWVGAESGSQKILDAMDKGTTVRQIFDATRLLQQNGIKTAFFLQFGYPGETFEDIRSTIRMVMELMPDEIGISISYPLPGTKFYEKVKYQLGEKQNWTDSDDLAMMFDSTFNSPFYKKLHRYVHSRYQARKGVKTLLKMVRQPVQTSVKDLRSVLGGVFHGLQVLYLQHKVRGTKRSRGFEPQPVN